MSLIKDKDLKSKIIGIQKNEITEYHIYMKLAKSQKDKKNKELLQTIAEDELKHYKFWVKYTQTEFKPKTGKIIKFFLITRILGLTFGLKLMEKGEEKAQVVYAEIMKKVPEAEKILNDEDGHEQELLNLLNEEKLNYIGSIVLGLNDALVELTGALAGLSFALQKTKLIALAGLITGIAASFSMAASEYLSSKSEGNAKTALKSALYTGTAYIITVFLLILPYFLLKNYIFCLIITLIIAVLIIFFFNYYISVVKDFSFKKRFLEMALLSLGIAGLSFIIGYVIRITLGVEV